ncbi:hypothetical protein NQ317_017543 [Molorchus minor]|uniref:Transposase n=1 Tax=Molorchus minor TaxID=1323400 RepID=A0ABQ9IQZ5_9CUCU|nr:hypothetical protein NQ317_017543 [Molorchus minor]
MEHQCLECRTSSGTISNLRKHLINDAEIEKIIVSEMQNGVGFHEENVRVRKVSVTCGYRNASKKVGAMFLAAKKRKRMLPRNLKHSKLPLGAVQKNPEEYSWRRTSSGLDAIGITRKPAPNV